MARRVALSSCCRVGPGRAANALPEPLLERTKLGLETMKVVVQRINEHFGRQIEWVPLSTLAARFVTAEKAKFEFEADEKSVRISLSSCYELM